MDEFVIQKVNASEYDCFLLCLSFESIATYKPMVESSPFIRHHTGKMLIDQLFITGNGQNRFICCNYVDGVLDFSSAQVVKASDCFKTLTVKWLNTHYIYVNHSILTESQRRCIRDCVPF